MCVAQAACTDRGFDNRPAHRAQCALASAKDAQRLKGLGATFGVATQPGESGGDRAMPPVQFALHPDPGLIGMHQARALHGLPDGLHGRGQNFLGLLTKRLRAGL